MIRELINPVSKILDKLVVDKDLKVKLEHEIKTEIQRANLAQIDVNKAEAQHRSIFVAGWRPFIGWICAVAMGYHFVLQPIIVFVLSANGVNYDLPEFDMGSLMTIVMGILGLGGMRSFEKYKGITK
jgi:hypothetical protein|tara:strand:- start:125 stop:505 length:381 start_codon:yes stop_codon:yes gene_type:complete